MIQVIQINNDIDSNNDDNENNNNDIIFLSFIDI